MGSPTGTAPVRPRAVLLDFYGTVVAEDDVPLGGSPRAINPEVPCDLVIDHSVQVDAFGSSRALAINAEKEFSRNRERYEFLKWGQQSLDNFRVSSPMPTRSEAVSV